jgi:fructose-1,6-bisphosphatase II
MREVTTSGHCPSKRNEVRLLQFDFLRATEMAALNCMPWIGKGEKESADSAACDAIRGMFDVMDIRGEIVIGEGIKDEAPGLFAGERVGNWREGTPRVDIAIDPLDGTTNFSKGLPNAISCIAVAVRGNENIPALQFVPAFYMKKLAYPPVVRKAWIKDGSLPLDINAPIADVIALTARLLEKSVRDVVVMVLDRPRNASIIEDVRSAGASLRMIVDGDISAALGPAMPKSGVDLYAGIGGAPEGILAAAGLRCMGGGMQAQMWPRDEQELASLAECGWSDHVEQVYRSRDLVHGNDILFIATGVSDSPLLRGVQVRGTTMITHSVLMRQRSGSVRFVSTEHDLVKRPLRLRSTNAASSVQENGRMTSFDSPHRDLEEPRRAVLQSSLRRRAKSHVSSFLLFGAPGSGKGTIGKALGALPGFTHCSSGDIIRAAASHETESSERWKSVASGALISDEDLWELFDEYLDRLVKGCVAACNEPMLLIDGIPRCHSQVVELSKRVEVRGVFHLDCGDPDTMVRRLQRRFNHDARPDDASEQVIHDRLRLFREQTLPLLKLYPDEIVHRIDATRRPDIVLSHTLKQIERVWCDSSPLSDSGGASFCAASTGAYSVSNFSGDL